MSELIELSVREFTSALASDAPAPGGGSASAAAGAQGAALLTMVVRLTLGKEKYRGAWEELERLLPGLQEAQHRLQELVDEDRRAFDAIVAARRLPKGTDAEKAERQQAIDRATILATTTPMQTAFFAEQALRAAPVVAEKGNPNAASDAHVGALLLEAALAGALANVRINLPGVADAELARGFREDADDLAEKSHRHIEKARAAAKDAGLLG